MGLVRTIVVRLLRWGKAPSPSDPQALGRWGEEQAVRFLRRKGYRILYRNYRARQGGEVDVVAREKATATLCFIEVKTRSSEQFGRPSSAVDEKKQRLILRGALAWLRLLNWPEVDFRFDIVEVVADQNPPRIEIIKNAFHPPPHFFY